MAPTDQGQTGPMLLCLSNIGGGALPAISQLERFFEGEPMENQLKLLVDVAGHNSFFSIKEQGKRVIQSYLGSSPIVQIPDSIINGILASAQPDFSPERHPLFPQLLKFLIQQSAIVVSEVGGTISGTPSPFPLSARAILCDPAAFPSWTLAHSLGYLMPNGIFSFVAGPHDIASESTVSGVVFRQLALHKFIDYHPSMPLHEKQREPALILPASPPRYSHKPFLNGFSKDIVKLEYLYVRNQQERPLSPDLTNEEFAAAIASTEQKTDRPCPICEVSGFRDCDAICSCGVRMCYQCTLLLSFCQAAKQDAARAQFEGCVALDESCFTDPTEPWRPPIASESFCDFLVSEYMALLGLDQNPFSASALRQRLSTVNSGEDSKVASPSQCVLCNDSTGGSVEVQRTECDCLVCLRCCVLWWFAHKDWACNAARHSSSSDPDCRSDVEMGAEATLPLCPGSVRRCPCVVQWRPKLAVIGRFLVALVGQAAFGNHANAVSILAEKRSRKGGKAEAHAK